MGEKINIELLYDTLKAVQNNQEMTKSMQAMDKANKNSVKSGGMAMAMAVAVGNVMAQGFNTLMSKMSGAIPALGETLSQAGTVIFNNLFKPLSDVLMPMLRDLMNWVRSNRVGFVQLGSVISGVFTAVVEIVKSVFGVISDIFSKVFGAVTGGAKSTFGNIANFLNLVLLKIVFLVQFVLILLEPVFSLIGDGVVFCINQLKEMFNFIVAFIQDPKKALEDFGVITIGLVIAGVIALGVAIFSAVVPAIWAAVAAAGAFVIAAAPFILIGVAIAALVKGIIWVIDHFGEIWDGIKKGLGKAWQFVKDIGGKIKGFFGGIVDWVVEKWNGIINWFKELPGRIAKAFSEAWEKVKTGAKELFDMFDPATTNAKLLKLKQEADAKAKGGGGLPGGNIANNQNNAVSVTVHGSPDPAADAQKLVKEAQAGNRIQNKEMAQGTR